MEDRTPEEIEHDEMMFASEEAKKRYFVRGFKTTTESIIYTKKMAQAVSSINGDINEIDVSDIFSVFDAELIKYVIETFVLKGTEDDFEDMDYESEFIGEFKLLISVFMMAVQSLSEKANGKGKPAPLEEGTQIISRKRSRKS